MRRFAYLLRHQTEQKWNGDCLWDDRDVIETTLNLARGGDEHAFRELTEPHRRALQLHCYRMLGSLQDAEDVVQDTMLAAWRGLDRFQERAPLLGWLYRIATNRSLNALRDRTRRPRSPLPDPPFEPPSPTAWDEPLRLEPYPDRLLPDIADGSPGPEAVLEMREAIELAFIAALQRLTARQRAALVLKDVLGYRIADVARMLGCSQISVKGSLQRARATLETRIPAAESDRNPQSGSERERLLASKFADAFERDDIDGMLALLSNDASLTMPPYPHAYMGLEPIERFLEASAVWREGRHFRLAATRANTQPAFGCYLQTPASSAAQPAVLLVLTLGGGRVTALTRFMDASLFPYFDLPPTLRSATSLPTAPSQSGESHRSRG